MGTPKPGDYGWGKTANGTIAFGPIREATTIRAGWFQRTEIPVSIWDKNAGRVIAVEKLVEWHPLEERS